jgi:hypothetical protein
LPGHRCTRLVTVHYRWDGYLSDLLGQIARVLSTAGWEVPPNFAAAGQLPPVIAVWRNRTARRM